MSSKSAKQLSLIEKENSFNLNKKDVTFSNNKKSSIHRWYPYIEGFSDSFVEAILDNYSLDSVIYDPFNGSGTTSTVSSFLGYKCYASEINPLMRFIAKTKVNTVKKIVKENKFYKINDFINKVHKKEDYNNIKIKDFINDCYLDDDFFYSNVLEDIAFIKSLYQVESDEDIKNICKLALASIIVKVSKMKRASDLRTKTDKDIKNMSFDAISLYCEKLSQIANDIKFINAEQIKKIDFLNNNAKTLNENLIGEIDLIITSPPYVNGTNYFRNSKLELWILDLINNNDNLKSFRKKAITAGINNVSSRIDRITKFSFVEEYATKLDKEAKDRRIPKLIRAYFSDMNKVFRNWSLYLKDGAKLYFDIGDSEYYGVHIPVDKIIEKIANKNDLNLIDSQTTRERKSRSGTKLSQKLMIFKKNKKLANKYYLYNNKDQFYKKAKYFVEELPYTKKPYSKRNWGHSWHSLCSYQGKLKPAIAHFLVKLFSSPQEKVLDPLSGVGTIPFEACLQNRIGVGNDLSNLAYIVTKSKLERPEEKDVYNFLKELESYIKENKERFSCNDYDNFGFNGKIPEYFEEETYKEILAGRNYFNNKIYNLKASEAVVFSAFLHVLHGNRPYALSRRSHPLTPYSPKGDFKYKKVTDHIKDKLDRSYKKTIDWSNYEKGQAYFGDYLNLSESLNDEVDIIITSPPFVGSLRFYTSNWLRLWLSGWEPDDFEEAKKTFLEAKQKRNIDVYYKFFELCSNILKDNGRMILHLGNSKKCNMALELGKRAENYFETILIGSESVGHIENHGIADKGATTDHQFLFLKKT